MGRGLLGVGVVAGLVSAGCSQPADSRRTPQTVYVSRERLAKQHPLSGSMAQLEDAWRRLERLAPPQSAERVGRSRPDARSYTLAPLVLPALEPIDVAGEQVRLQATSARRLAAFAERLAAQQERALRRRREELEAIRAAGRAQERREGEVLVYARTRLLREQRAAQIANLEIRINTLAARIAIVPPPPERAQLEAHRRELETELALARTQAVEAEAALWAALEMRVAEAARRDTAEIARRIDAQRAAARSAARQLVRTQQKTLEQDLALVAPSQLAPRSVAGPYVIDTPLGPGPGVRGGTEHAVLRIKQQQQSLQSFINADVEARVQDAAAEQNVVVTFDKATPGAPDRTAAFAQRVVGDQVPPRPAARKG